MPARYGPCGRGVEVGGPDHLTTRQVVGAMPESWAVEVLATGPFNWRVFCCAVFSFADRAREGRLRLDAMLLGILARREAAEIAG